MKEGVPIPSRALRERVLLVDSQDDSRRAVQLLLQGCGMDVRAFASAGAALAETALDQIRTLLISRELSDGDAIHLLRQLAMRGWRGRAILIGRSHAELDEEARAAGFASVVKKPVGRLELLGALAR
ncbi:response regulator [Sphingomonas sp. TDK1]|uniref:response regulator n=1 Tax=Sphingomonas sp. TDK1 TaxID=453247 RepID=UPI0007D9CC37|nr:response regulator [Sphingomonas sp. TDK1]OAN61567.1 response regulator receiver protein [Sphingomonas sp. TDK1]